MGAPMIFVDNADGNTFMSHINCLFDLIAE